MTSLNDYFTVRSADKGFRRVVPKRIESIRPFQAIDNARANWMKTEAYGFSGLSEFDPCWTGEMAARPIPFVSTDPRPLKTQQAFERYIKEVLAFLAPHIKPAIQTINKVSALGYPVNGNPGDGIDKKALSRTFGQKVTQSKFDVTLELFAPMYEGDFSVYADGYHTIGCRKQNESPFKEREFQFITSEGEVVQRTITGTDREIEVPQVGPMIGSRSRTIVRPPVVNLYLQCVDTLIHNAIKKHPLFDSNVYTKQIWPEGSHFVTFDCKHYERYLGLCALSYARAIGGAYEAQLLQLIYYPFVVPSDDWTRFFEIRPLYTEGVYPQFSSGLSPVAPLGKLANVCVQVAYFHEVVGLDTRSAVAAVFSGVHGDLRRWSFGDDNRVLGPRDQADEFCAFMGSYFDIEFDDTPTFLGTIFRPDLGRWVLPRKTYNLKLYQPERDYEFKDFPNLGMVARRDTFTEFGEPEIARDIIPFENELWNAVDHPYVKIVAAAIAERQEAQRKGIKINEYVATDKDYLMSEEQKVASGLFWHFKEDVTASIFNKLVGDELRGQVSFGSQPVAPFPQPTSAPVPFSQAGLTLPEDETELEETI